MNVDNRATVKAARIAAVGAVIAALTGGLFLLLLSRCSDTKGIDSGQVAAGPASTGGATNSGPGAGGDSAPGAGRGDSDHRFHRLSASQILEKSVDLYKTCVSYSDSGEVEAVFLGESGQRTVVLPFETLFDRDRGFRFEFRKRKGEYEWDRYIVVKNTRGVRSWWDLRGVDEVHESLTVALAGATGVSKGASTAIPSLLLPEEVEARNLTNLVDLRRLADEQVESRTFFRLAGSLGEGHALEVWIDQASFLVARLRAEARIEGRSESNRPPFWVETTTTFKAQIGVDIPDERFAP